MLFNSFSFLIFFPTVTALYFLLPHKYRWMMLLVASIIFYMFFIPAYIFILILTIIIDYWAAILIENSQGKKRKKYLIISIFSTCLVLAVFKYFNFFNANFAAVARLLDLNYPIEMLNIILPIGLSFHTFQSLSYVIEVYRGKQKAEKHLGIYSLYVMFYPQLVAGPIERPQNLLHQFREKHLFNYTRVTDGLKLMAWGMFKKVVIADRLAIVVNQIYGNPQMYEGPDLIIATIFFAFQIYCDFSGYSNIAIGAAQVMGFRLMKNFNRPYFSRSISEFWRRWHISLSSWFKDYVYIPLGGNRVSLPMRYLNLMIVFLISGLWHGANWTFIIWGFLHGVYMILEIMTKPFRIWRLLFYKLEENSKLIKLLEISFTFVLVCTGWIFFRANTVSDAFYILTHLFTNISSGLSQISIPISEIIIIIMVIGFMESIHLIEEKRAKNIIELLKVRPLALRWSAYMFLLWLILFLGVFSQQQFIYFQF